MKKFLLLLTLFAYNSLIYCAAISNQEMSVEEIDQMILKNKSTMTSLMAAVHEQDTSAITKALNEPIEIDPNDTEAIIKALSNPPLINIQDHMGRTALYHAARINSASMIKELLNLKRIQPNLTDKDGYTPLMVAVDLGNYEAAQALLSACNKERSNCTNLNIRDRWGRPALMRAVLNNDIKMAHLLLMNGARWEIGCVSKTTQCTSNFLGSSYISQLQEKDFPDANNLVKNWFNDIIEVHAKTLTGKTISVAISKSDFIIDLKDKIMNVDGIPWDQQRLIFQGTQLHDDKTVDSYNIMNDSVIHLVLRLRGGNGNHTYKPYMSEENLIEAQLHRKAIIEQAFENHVIFGGKKNRVSKMLQKLCNFPGPLQKIIFDYQYPDYELPAF